MKKKILIAITVLILIFVLSQVHVYNGLNKGFTVGNFGIELVGDPGVFYGDY